MIKVDVNATRLIQKLEGLSDGLGDLTPVWTQVHEIFINFIKRLFETEGGYVGDAWESLSPAYAKWKARQGDKGILQLRGALYRGLTEPGDSAHIFRMGPSFMEAGTNIPYARFHQTGTLRMPKRPPIKPFSKVEGQMAADVVLAYLLERTRRGSR